VHLLALLPSWLDPETLIEKGGLALVAAIVFAESGLLIGFFLPGDSLLFVTGFLVSKPADLPHIDVPLPIVLAVLTVAAVVGDQVGYLFGRRVGPALFDRPDSRIFRQDHVRKAHAFFERHGAKTIVLARFVPIVRTFAPILAGVSSMSYRTFVTYNVLGGVLWAAGLTTAGYFLGQIDVVKNNIEIATPLLVVLSILPMVYEVVKHRRRQARAALAEVTEPAA
jgi:membrane-associated protein